MIQNLLSNLKQENKIGITANLLLCTFFTITLISVRIKWSFQITYIFLAWNLFLAWIPFVISTFIKVFGKNWKFTLPVLLLLGLWLLFLPNSPYILTDLYHLKQRPRIPLWYDIILLSSAVWTGVMLGLLSIMDIHHFIRQKVNIFMGWLVVVFSVILCSFGIYLGRFLRWNSWDVLSDPTGIMMDINQLIIHPFANIRVYGISLLLTVFLLLIYFSLNLIAGRSNRSLPE